MLYPKDRNIHRPPHIYLDNTIYFIVSRTLDGIHFFDTDNKKKVLLQTILEIADKYKIILHSWVLLNNHYQLIAEFVDG